MIELQNIKPVRDFVLLKELTQKEKSGIILSKGMDTPYTVAEILKAGPEAKEYKGKVMIKRYQFEEMEDGGEVYFIGQKDGIIATV